MALAVAVLHVFPVGTKPKVFAFDAKSVIAGMANLHSVGNWAVVKLPSGAVGVASPAVIKDAPIPPARTDG